MITLYCYGISDGADYCARCGASLLAPNQICQGVEPIDIDEPIDPPEPLTRRDWKMLLRGAQRERNYLLARTARPSSLPDGADAHNLERVRRVIRIITAAVGER